ncbi:MAG: aminotransferase class I/II-fold pyridoxal phosphate-dependent enzyme, partial [Eggerthellaceae bacterium]|nr:aminotransferase class I/II-fold pyridoxal phosphate-dependent enzyme [Eggerthellaceae bacterium]
MNRLRPAAPQLASIEPYDPKYIPADVMISANENPLDVPFEIRREVERAIRKVPFNRYPDPLANQLRDMIADANGLERNQVLMGNGGDELLFDMALAFGGPGRTFLNMPPTFSVYVNNAQLTNTSIVNVPRRADFTVDEDAVIERLAQGDIDYTIVTSPNNPTGDIVTGAFVKR